MNKINQISIDSSPIIPTKSEQINRFPSDKKIKYQTIFGTNTLNMASSYNNENSKVHIIQNHKNKEPKIVDEAIGVIASKAGSKISGRVLEYTIEKAASTVFISPFIKQMNLFFKFFLLVNFVLGLAVFFVQMDLIKEVNTNIQAMNYSFNQLDDLLKLNEGIA